MISAHQWTNGGGGEVLILKCVPLDGVVSGNRDQWMIAKYGERFSFTWPLEVGAVVEAPDWEPSCECGGGLHGWPWGLSMGDGKTPDWSGAWLVFGAVPSDVVDVKGKCKARRGTIRFVGTWDAATAFVLSGQICWIQQASSGAASATGERGAASATGERGAASATGERGAASATGCSGAASATGESGAASATGWRGAASATGCSGAASATGERGAASATGWRGAASATGDASSATVTGMGGRAMAGEFGCIALAWWNSEGSRSEMRCALTGSGPGSLKAHVWYKLNETGDFVEEV